MGRVTFAITLSLIAECAVASCEAKDYARLKDKAMTRVGQMEIAFDYCRANAALASARKIGEPALESGRLREAEEANRVIFLCSAETSQITSALQAANAYKALKFAQGGCKGRYPK
jgi:hypothetical protein